MKKIALYPHTTLAASKATPSTFAKPTPAEIARLSSLTVPPRPRPSQPGDNVREHFNARKPLADEIHDGLMAAMAEHPELAAAVQYGSIDQIDEILDDLGLDYLLAAQRSLADFDQDWLDDRLG